MREAERRAERPRRRLRAFVVGRRAHRRLPGQDRPAPVAPTPTTARSGRRRPRTAALVRVRAGIRIRELNALLDDQGLGLSNMGGYDHQTVAGVISTSTHGSGIRFGPLNDVVRSLDLVVAGGGWSASSPRTASPMPGLRRPHGSDRTSQDDERFHGAVCGMGCMGSWTRRARGQPEYFLKEGRLFHTWEEVRADLGRRRARRHGTTSLLQPVPPQGRRHELLVTTRTEVPSPEELSSGDGERIGSSSSSPRSHCMGRAAAPGALLAVALRTPFGRRWRKCDEYTRSPTGCSTSAPPTSCPRTRASSACRWTGTTTCARSTGSSRWRTSRPGGRRLFHTSPIALRFVAPSHAYASMMHGHGTMMIELILVSEHPQRRKLLAGVRAASP